MSGLEVPPQRQDSMTNVSPRGADPVPSDDSQSLTDKVAERVMNARLAIESRANTRRSSSRIRPTANVAEQREVKALKRVFRDLGDSYRRYRSQTGGPVVPGLRDAAMEFRADPSLSSLVAVAVYLDKLDLLN